MRNLYVCIYMCVCVCMCACTCIWNYLTLCEYVCVCVILLFLFFTSTLPFIINIINNYSTSSVCACAVCVRVCDLYDVCVCVFDIITEIINLAHSRTHILHTSHTHTHHTYTHTHSTHTHKYLLVCLRKPGRRERGRVLVLLLRLRRE